MPPTLFRVPALLLSVCALLLGAEAAHAQAPPRYSAEYLGPALGVASMNAGGQCVGYVTSPAVRSWVAGPGQLLTLLPLPPGRASSWALDVNDAGDIAGAVSSSSSPEFGGVAAVWSPDGQGGYTVLELGMLPGHQRSEATALNDAGDVVGWSQSGMFRYPVLFTAPGGIQDLSSTGIFDPRDINDLRVLVDGSFTAKRLDLNTMVVTDLGVPTGLPQNYLATSAAAINASNQVCGAAILTTSTSCDRQAARHADGVGWEVFSTCGPFNGAHDINDLGDVVMRINLEPHVRFEGLGTYRIEDLIDPSGGYWTVLHLYGLAINNARQMAVTAKNLATGQTGIVLLTPESDVGTPLCPGDGSAGACPCGNASASGSGQGCLHSAGSGALLRATGSAVVANDDLVLRVSQGPPGKVALFIQGVPAPALPFKDGLLCAASPILRLQPLVLGPTGAGASSVSIVATGQVSPGSSRAYQTWFRDPTGPCGKGSNLSSAVQVDWQ